MIISNERERRLLVSGSNGREKGQGTSFAFRILHRLMDLCMEPAGNQKEEAPAAAMTKTGGGKEDWTSD